MAEVLKEVNDALDELTGLYPEAPRCDESRCLILITYYDRIYCDCTLVCAYIGLHSLTV